MHFEKAKIKKAKKSVALFSIILVIITVVSLFVFPIGAQAAPRLTSIGLAEFGLKAYKDGWLYNYGSIGQMSSSGKRMSDCSGLIYAYFTDNGTTGPRVVTQQAAASIQSGDMSTMPRIHGLLLTIYNYDHVGIYIGNNEAVDNSTYGVNMCKNNIYTRDWIQWNMLDAGVLYPTNGFYAFNGRMYHYTNRQYDINTTVTSGDRQFLIGADGVVCDESGIAIPVDNSMPNEGFAKAQPISLSAGNGNSGIKPGSSAIQGTVTASSVRIRSQASTSSQIVQTLFYGNIVSIAGQVQGETITSGGRSSSLWYQCTTSTGVTGYITSLFVQINQGQVNTADEISAPRFSYENDSLTISTTSENAAVYYTVDGSQPSETNGMLYTDPIFFPEQTTYKAIAISGNTKSKVSTASLFADGKLFTDVSLSDWHYDYVKQVISQRYFLGYPDNTFRPTKPITRAEFVSVLANAAGIDTSAYTNLPFPDVTSSQWYAGAVAWASENGYMKGMSDGAFAPDKGITRQEVCVVILNYLGLNDVDSYAFADDDQIADWALRAVYACRHYGLISGNNENMFNPHAIASRVEISKIITLMQNLAK